LLAQVANCQKATLVYGIVIDNCSLISYRIRHIGATMKKVTIGICVRNCEKTIFDALESVIHQDFPLNELEIIVVDDGSTDKTLEIVKNFASGRDISFKIFSQPWRGIAAARNVVVRESKAKYIVWVDGDMRLSRDYLRKQVGFMDSHPSVGAAKGTYAIQTNRKIIALLENSRAIDLISLPSELWGTGGAIFRVSALRQIGGFDERIKGAGEDTDVIIRLQKKGWLTAKTEAKFYERYKETLKELWSQYFWWGYGAHFVKHKHRNTVTVFTRLPLIAFLKGVLRFLIIYRRERKIMYILLPFYELFKETAWLMGFIISHLEGYGH